MAVSWQLWKDELKSPVPEADRQTRSTDRVQMTGYWRIEAAKTKPDYPVLIWTEADKADVATVFQIGRKVMNTTGDVKKWEEFCEASWLWCRAVTREDYARAMDTGFWPDDNKPARQMTDEEKLGIDTSTGGNNPPIEESLADQIAALVAKVTALEVKDKPTADTASGYLDKLRKLLELAEAERVKEKAPHAQAAAQVDAKWSAVRDPGIAAGAKLKLARDTWLKNEQARLDAIAEAENKKRREAAEAENAKRRAEADAAAEAEAERLRKEAAQHGQQVDEQEIAARVAETVAPPVEVKPVEVKPEVAKASSTFGRATSAKKTKVAQITDRAKLVAFLMDGGVPDEPAPDADFLDYLQVRANKAMRGKITLPGVEIVEE